MFFWVRKGVNNFGVDWFFVLVMVVIVFGFWVIMIGNFLLLKMVNFILVCRLKIRGKIMVFSKNVEIKF